MSNKKRENKEIRKRHELLKEIKDNPDWCYCYELHGLEPDIDMNIDLPIGKTKPVDGYPYWNSTNYTQDIYICKRCLKKCTLGVAFG